MRADRHRPAKIFTPGSSHSPTHPTTVIPSSQLFACEERGGSERDREAIEGRPRSAVPTALYR
eukprot:5101325-Alexandrium_andersonii.AAC.1